jgi:formate hydrogenlyase subunit 3/multisubunit Na+/H+ antiporter MnhD subunit
VTDKKKKGQNYVIDAYGLSMLFQCASNINVVAITAFSMSRKRKNGFLLNENAHFLFLFFFRRSAIFHTDLAK